LSLDVDSVASALDPTDVLAAHWRTAWLSEAAPNQVPPPGDWSVWLLLGGRGGGKLLCNDTRLPTPSGWTTMGDVTVGDELFDEAGRVCRVTAKFAPPVAQAYRLTFSDDSHIDADAGHQWVTWLHRDRKQYLRQTARHEFPHEWPVFSGSVRLAANYGPKIRTSEQIRATLRHGARQDLNHCIPLAQPLHLPDANLPIPPWLLGYWLGNGTAASGEVTAGSHAGNMDGPFIEACVSASGYECARHDYPLHGQSRINVRGLSKLLKEQGLRDRKYVPPQYLRASVEQRLALLRGLMDSDGYASSKAVEFCSTDKALAESVLELVRTLGERAGLAEGGAMLNGQNYGSKYRVTWRPGIFNPFSLPRKAARVPPLGAQGLRNRHRMIVSVEPIPTVPMSCIAVNSRNSMYLAGEAMIPTHNTRPLVEESAWAAHQYPGIRVHALSPTLNDVRRTLMEGVSGYLAKVPPELIKAYNKNDRELHFVNGSVIYGFSATEEADRLRGPACHMIAFDEAAAADKPPGNLEAVYRVAKLGCRMPMPDGSPNRKLIATTPRPIPFLKKLMADPRTRVVRRTTYDNLKNLSRDFADELLSMEGTTYGRQELHGELIDSEESGIFKRAWFRLWPATKPLPEFSFILMVMDTAFEEEAWNKKRQEADFSACAVFGVFNTKQCFTEAELKKLNVKHQYAALLCDFWMERLGFPELLDRARRTYRTKYGGRDKGKFPNVVLIENKASGISLRQTLSKFNVPCWPFNPGNQSKTMRAHASAPMVLQGNCFVPESTKPERRGEVRNWVEPMLEQVCAFAGEGSTQFDDAVDVLTSAMIYFQSRDILVVTPQVGVYPDPDEKEDAKALEAMRLYDQEKHRKVAPYG
jgi:phage terminase large subunit-like protein